MKRSPHLVNETLGKQFVFFCCFFVENVKQRVPGTLVWFSVYFAELKCLDPNSKEAFNLKGSKNKEDWNKTELLIRECLLKRIKLSGLAQSVNGQLELSLVHCGQRRRRLNVNHAWQSLI